MKNNFKKAGKLLWAEWDINLDEVPLEHLDYYIAVENYLTEEDKLPPDAPPIEQVSSYLESLYHLCQLQVGERIKSVLILPISINPQPEIFSLPLYEYLIFKNLERNLLKVIHCVLSSLKYTKDDVSFFILLKARTLSSIRDTGTAEEACNIFREIRLHLQNNVETYIEATAYLGIRQVYSGIYKEGISNCQEAMTMINNLIKTSGQTNLNWKMWEIKSDILEVFAFYEMNLGRFQKANHLYKEIIDLRKQIGTYHKLISPLVHQGIVMRKMKKYNEAIEYLTEAKNQDNKTGNKNYPTWINHHLAYVHLNQGNLPIAEELCKSSLKEYKKLENQEGISDCYEQLGLIHLAKNEWDNAEKNFKIALDIRESIGNRHGKASALLDLALASYHKKWYFKSIIFVIKGLVLYYKIGILNRIRLSRMLRLVYVWTVGKRNWTM